MAARLGTAIYGLGFRFSPTPKEAVTYYLPRLVSGDPLALPEIVSRVIHRTDVYGCEPADLARRFRPMPSTHNRFFFTFVRKRVRAAGPGSWAGQSTVEIEIKDNKGGKVKIGELRKFRYKKRGVLTDWLMEEYSACGLDGAAAGDMQPVMCKVYVSPKAAPNSAAYQESAACFAPPPPPPAAAKRPALAPDAMSPCAKRMRVSALQPPPPPPPTLSSLTALRKMPFTPPQQSLPRRLPRRCLMTRSPASAPPPAPPAPPLVAVRKIPFVPPHPSLPRRCSTTPAATQPSPGPTPPSAPSDPSPSPLVAVQKMSVTPSPLEDDDVDFAKAIEDMLSDEEEEATVAAAAAADKKMSVTPSPLEDDDEDFAKAIENMLSDEEEETPVAAAAADKLQLEVDDDEFAKVMDMLSAEAEEATVESNAALFSMDAFFNFSEEDL